jgi:hypothetical protein
MVQAKDIIDSLIPRDPWHHPSNTNRGGRISTVDLLIKVACFVKEEIMFSKVLDW